MKSILDPSFRYRASFETDLQKTFASIRRAQQKVLSPTVPAASSAPANVASIVGKTATGR